MNIKKEVFQPPFFGTFSLPQQKMPMNKSSFFTGQPIFNQVLNFIPRSVVSSVSRELSSDRYCKTFRTYDHLVTMLYAVLNQCNSLREVTTGLLAWDSRIAHLGIDSHPRRSTIADANKRRSEEVFEKIYYKLLERYSPVLPDSRRRNRKNNLYIFDSTTIALFQEILKGSGLSKADGKRKGGIKVHTLLRSDQDTPCMIRYSEGAANDGRFLKEIRLPKGSVIVFDKGYRDYSTYNRFTRESITWVTRHRDSSVYTELQSHEVTEFQQRQGIISDKMIVLGHQDPKATKVTCRMIHYRDPLNKMLFTFITNNVKLAPYTIASYYRQRWQIETFFKRIKQNYPLHYFLGDNENAIKIQIWTALIADLILKVIKQGTRTKMAFTTIVSLIRLHLMTYMDLNSFIKEPEKSLLRKMQMQRKRDKAPSLFDS